MNRGRVCSSSRPPVEALGLIRKHHTLYRKPNGKHHLERIAFDLTSDRTQNREPDLLVICAWRDDQGRTPSRLLVACLRREVDPNDVAAVGTVSAQTHHNSFPTGGPVSI